MSISNFTTVSPVGLSVVLPDYLVQGLIDEAEDMGCSVPQLALGVSLALQGHQGTVLTEIGSTGLTLLSSEGVGSCRQDFSCSVPVYLVNGFLDFSSTAGVDVSGLSLGLLALCVS